MVANPLAAMATSAVLDGQLARACVGDPNAHPPQAVDARSVPSRRTPADSRNNQTESARDALEIDMETVVSELAPPWL